MKLKNIYIFIFALLLSIFFQTKISGQTNNDFSKFKKIKIYKAPKKNNYSYAKKQFKTYQVVFSGMFLFYKSFLSSQDSGSCPFEISCSVYMIKSVQKCGIFIGFLNGIDRYTRCNGHSNMKYKISKKSKRLYDPVN